MMEKPDVDSIDGLSPAISIDQKTTQPQPALDRRHGHRDLRLPAPALRPHRQAALPGLRPPDRRPEPGVDRRPDPPAAGGDEVHRQRAGRARPQGRVQGRLRGAPGGGLHAREGRRRAALLEEEIVLDKKFKHTIEVVVDRLVMKADLRTRLAQSVETAAQLADGLVVIDVLDGEPMTFSENFACPEHGVGLPELEPRIFSFNSPHGACPRCTGLGAQQEIDPDLLVPDPTLSIGEGALVPWSLGNSSFYESVIQAIADRYEIDLEAPWQELTEEQQNLFLYGTDGDKVYVQYRNRMGRRALLHARLRRHRREPRAPLPRDRLEPAARAHRGVHELPAVPGLQRRAPQARGAGGHRRRAEHPRVHAHVGAARDRVRGRARADRDRAADRRADPEGDPRAADVPRERRRRLPAARPRRLHALRRRGAAPAARDADREPARRRALHPRRAVDRPAPAGQRQADRDARAAARPRQHRARGGARRADDARRRPPRRHGPGRRRARRPRRRRGHGEGGRAQREVGHRPVPLRQARDRDPGAALRGPRHLLRARRADAQPEGHRRRVPGREVHLRDRASRAPASRRS